MNHKLGICIMRSYILYDIEDVRKLLRANINLQQMKIILYINVINIYCKL